MNRGRLLLAFAAAGLILEAGDWLTFGGNPQRTGSPAAETKITRENAGKLAIDWKLRLENTAKELTSLSAPVVAESVFTPKGVKDIVVVAGSADTLFAIDADRGSILWKRTFAAEGVPKNASHWLCPNALNATPVIRKLQGVREKTVFAVSSDGKLHGLSMIDGEDVFPALTFVPPFSKNWSLNLFEDVLYTPLSQNCNGGRSAVYAVNLKDPARPVSRFQAGPAGSGIWGRAGVAIGSQGFVYAETGDGPWDPAAGKYADTVLKLSGTDLHLVDYYTPSNHEWISRKDLDMGAMSPVVFPFKQRELLAAGGKEGVIYLLDTKALGGQDHRTPLYRSPLYANEDVDFAGRGFWGAFATWESGRGERWLYVPALGPAASQAPSFPSAHGAAPNGSIMAFKVEEKEGKPVLSPAWISRDMDAPEPPIVSNGVVFAISSGENTRQQDAKGNLMNSAQRASTARGDAVLYAFDAETGAELYSSGKQISSFTHFSGLAMSWGRIYVSTFDSTLYQFGLKPE